MRIVLDTNSLLASLGRRSPYRIIFDSIIEGRLTLLVTTEIILEYTEVLERENSVGVAMNVYSFLQRSPDVELCEIYFRWSLIYEDANDNKFVDCAINGNANLLVTDDKHSRSLSKLKFPKVRLIKTDEFAEMLRG